MKTIKIFQLSILFITLSVISCKDKTNEIKNVSAKWNGAWYEAQIISESNNTFHVKFYDAVEADIKSEDIIFPLKQAEIKIDDRVMAVWNKGKYYQGSILEIQEKGAIVVWDDGSQPSFVAFGKIVKGFPKTEKLLYNDVSGKKVCADWNGTFYEAKIVSEINGKIHVIYSDNMEKELEITDIKELIQDVSEIKIKDRVLAVWTSGKFYPGEVNKIENDGIIVKWDDGSKPSFVSIGKFVKQQ